MSDTKMSETEAQRGKDERVLRDHSQPFYQGIVHAMSRRILDLEARLDALEAKLTPPQ